MPSRVFDDQKEANIGQLYRAGLSTGRIARLLESNEATIRAVLKRVKVAIRTQQQAV